MNNTVRNPITNEKPGVRLNLAGTSCSDLPRRPYSIIYADPPWTYRSRNHGRGGAADHYDTLSIDELKAMVLPAARDCALFLWATWPLLQDAFDLIRAWGFEYRSVAFCWVKLNPLGKGLATGLGAWTRANTEPCLLATKGRPTRVSRSVHSVVVSPRRRHSEKPDEVRGRIVELLGELPRLELFARHRVPGWDAWGNEVEDERMPRGGSRPVTSAVHRSRAHLGVHSVHDNNGLRSRTPYRVDIQLSYGVGIQGEDDCDLGSGSDGR